MPQASLLQDVLKQQLDALADAQRRLEGSSLESTSGAAMNALLTPPESDEDDLIDVTSGMATPVPRSRTITRSPSPTRQLQSQTQAQILHKSHVPSPLSRTTAGGMGRRGDRTPRDDPSSIYPSLVQSLMDATTAISTSRAKMANETTRPIGGMTEAVTKRDPLRLLPDKVRITIFCLLDLKNLLSCSVVCQRWKKSQTINHAFYQIYRTEMFMESESLPVGKWTKRESKKDWRVELINARRMKKKDEQPWFSAPSSKSHTPSYRDGAATPIHQNLNSSYQRESQASSGTGHLTPRELQEEEWARESETSPTKQEMRSFYKEYGGKRIRKSKTGMTGGMRDRTAWDD